MAVLAGALLIMLVAVAVPVGTQVTAEQAQDLPAHRPQQARAEAAQAVAQRFQAMRAVALGFQAKARTVQ